MSKLQVRLLRDNEREKYRLLMEKWHYLGATESHLNQALQYVAEDKDGNWMGLLDWGYATLKNESRDQWIGWDKEQSEKRRKYVIQNTRFLILPWAREQNLASQILSKCTRMLNRDWSFRYGHGVCLAETFVDPSRFEGTCYKAANWECVGETKGFGRSGSGYYEHGQQKRVFVYELRPDAKKILTSRGFPHPFLSAEQSTKKQLDLNRLPLNGAGGLLEALRGVIDVRGRQGIRYKLESMLALCVCGVLVGIRSVLGIAEYGQLLDEAARTKLGFRRFRMPSEPAIRRLLHRIDAAQFDAVISAWITKHVAVTSGMLVAVDGKTMRATRIGEREKPLHILTALLEDEGVVLKQECVSEKSNEIPAVKPLLEPLNITRAMVTLDAMHTQKETAKFIVEEKHADYLMTVKGNQPELKKSLESIPEDAFSPCIQNC